MNRRAFASFLTVFGLAPAVAVQDAINLGTYPNGRCPTCQTPSRPAPKLVNVSAGNNDGMAVGYDRHSIIGYPGSADWFIEDCQKCKTLYKVEVNK